MVEISELPTIIMLSVLTLLTITLFKGLISKQLRHAMLCKIAVSLYRIAVSIPSGRSKEYRRELKPALQKRYAGLDVSRALLIFLMRTDALISVKGFRYGLV